MTDMRLDNVQKRSVGCQNKGQKMQFLKMLLRFLNCITGRSFIFCNKATEAENVYHQVIL